MGSAEPCLCRSGAPLVGGAVGGGVVSVSRARWSRRLAAVPSPQRAATSSTDRSVASSSRRASSSRCAVSHRRGVSPVSSRKWRARVRGAHPACSARSATDSGWARCCSAHAQVAASPCPGGGRGRCSHCAWPPSRWGATTMRRAICTAASAPWSVRTRCKHRSIPAATPALVDPPDLPARKDPIIEPTSSARPAGSSTPPVAGMRASACPSVARRRAIHRGPARAGREPGCKPAGDGVVQLDRRSLLSTVLGAVVIDHELVVASVPHGVLGPGPPV